MRNRCRGIDRLRFVFVIAHSVGYRPQSNGLTYYCERCEREDHVGRVQALQALEDGPDGLCFYLGLHSALNISRGRLGRHLRLDAWVEGRLGHVPPRDLLHVALLSLGCVFELLPEDAREALLHFRRSHLHAPV